MNKEKKYVCHPTCLDRGCICQDEHNKTIIVCRDGYRNTDRKLMTKRYEAHVIAGLE